MTDMQSPCCGCEWEGYKICEDSCENLANYKGAHQMKVKCKNTVGILMKLESDGAITSGVIGEKCESHTERWYTLEILADDGGLVRYRGVGLGEIEFVGANVRIG